MIFSKNKIHIRNQHVWMDQKRLKYYKKIFQIFCPPKLDKCRFIMILFSLIKGPTIRSVVCFVDVVWWNFKKQPEIYDNNNDI